jgi:purine nucleosidase
MSRRFLIDTDTASDDAVALVMALRHPDIVVEAITVVAGNVPVELGVQNALYTVEICDANVPVHAGAAAPMMRELHTAQNVHGADGMGDIGLPLTGRRPAGIDAARVIVDLARKYPGELTIVTLGPLTNLALAVLAAPDIVPLVSRVVMMGGTGQGPGNVTPAAEFNIWCDPEAADVVFRSDLPLEMVGWDISRVYATISEAESAEFRRLGPIGEFCTDIQKVLLEFCRQVTHLPGYDLPDPIAMAVAIDPTIGTDVRELFVTVETTGTRTLGETVVDHLGVCQQPGNVKVVLAASRERFVEMLTAAMTP